MPTARPLDRRRQIRSLIASALLALLVGFIALVHFHPWTKPHLMRVAVANFENATGNKAYDKFAGTLTSSVAREMETASADKYDVLSGKSLLKTSVERRDWKAIGDSLGAAYVVSGVLRPDALGVRVEVTLVHLPDKEHVWVVSVARKVTDMKKAPAEIARSVSEQISPRLTMLAADTK